MTRPAEILYAVPVGTVIAWYPPPGAELPPGFVLCDGAPITDGESPFDGQAAPDLTNRFVLGAGNGVAAAAQGGSPGFNVEGWQSGAITTTPTQVSLPEDDVPNAIVVRQGSSDTYRYELTSNDDGWNDGNHHHEVAGLTVPAPGWLALTYIMRIK